jgi:hypothetical protein
MPDLYSDPPDMAAQAGDFISSLSSTSQGDSRASQEEDV